MKIVLILRHAKSSWQNASLSDHDRPLNKRGQQDAPRMGQLLQQHGLTPDLIISSTAERAMTTAELVALSSGYEAEITYTHQLYLAAPEAYLACLRQVDDGNNAVMLVGHNPGIEELVALFSGQYERMPTGALAYMELSLTTWADLRPDTPARLVTVWRPKELT